MIFLFFMIEYNRILGVVQMNDLTKNKLIVLIDKLIEEKLAIDENFLRFSFYEVRVKGEVTSEEENDFLELAETKLKNMRYTVYLQEQDFVYNEARRKVQPNELLIAIKKR